MKQVHPILALVGAVVLIDLFCDQSITSVLRRNRGEAFIGLAWLAVHILKPEVI